MYKGVLSIRVRKGDCRSLEFRLYSSDSSLYFRSNHRAPEQKSRHPKLAVTHPPALKIGVTRILCGLGLRGCKRVPKYAISSLHVLLHIFAFFPR